MSDDAASMSEREQVLVEYRAKIREHREVEARLKRLRDDVRGLVQRYQKTEDDLQALQSVGQIIGDVLKRLDDTANDDDRFIVKASSGPRYVVGCRQRLNRSRLKPGTRVALDMTTLTIMRVLPREVDPTVFHMQAEEEEGGGVSFADIGGLSEQIRELREVIELPLTNPELFIRVGIKPPKGVLLYGKSLRDNAHDLSSTDVVMALRLTLTDSPFVNGKGPPGTGKTLLARALACNINATFLKVVASAIVDKYIGESARIIREMFGFARDHEPCVIFMDGT